MELSRSITIWLFTWREEQEDPRGRENFTLGLHAETSVHVVPKKRRLEKELKMAGDNNKNAIWVLMLRLITSVTNYLSAEIPQ